MSPTIAARQQRADELIARSQEARATLAVLAAVLKGLTVTVVVGVEAKDEGLMRHRADDHEAVVEQSRETIRMLNGLVDELGEYVNELIKQAKGESGGGRSDEE